MSIFDNELVQKYFGDGTEINAEYFSTLSRNILDAMQQPIRKGDICIHVRDDGIVIGPTIWINEYDGFHPHDLRLPDEFQKKEKGPTTCTCGESNIIHRHINDGPCYYMRPPCEDYQPAPSPEKCAYGCEPHAKPDVIETKIRVIMLYTAAHGNFGLESFLRNLVALVRAEKEDRRD